MRGSLCLARLLLAVYVQAAPAELVLFDNRADRDEITEIRFDVPEGCVITGLGFRAHYDNITTMDVRYHRLGPGGTLSDPEEVRLGPEPDHVCEGKVLLPEGRAAVGFGLAGEPEWDVTLVRVWARTVNDDGTLGEIETFSDGFKPTRDPERMIVLDDARRVLTGVGARFGSNDISGIYGASRRILVLDDEARTRLEGLKTHGCSVGTSPLSASRSHLLEIDLWGQAAVRAGLADVDVDRWASLLVRGALGGAQGVIVSGERDRISSLAGVNKLNLRAIEVLIENPLEPAERVWERLSPVRSGEGSALVRRSLHHAARANAMFLGALGVRFLWPEGSLIPADAARQSLERRLGERDAMENLESVRRLLKPTDDVLRELNLERDTALWHLRQSVAAAESAAEATACSHASPFAKELLEAVKRTEKAVTFCRTVTECFALAQLYAQDGALETRRQVEQALEALPKLAEDLTAALDDGSICRGLEAFMTSVRMSLEVSSRNAPIQLAVHEARTLSEAGQDDAAAQKLLDIITSEDLSPHLVKNKLIVGELASSLKALWEVPDNLKSLRGGDGQWSLCRKSGRWCWCSTERFPCIYFDVLEGPLETRADYTLIFEYFDEGDFDIHIHYDSDYLGGLEERQFHPAETVRLTNTKTWRTVSRTLENCLFTNGQNESADMRLLAGRGRIIYVRNLKLRRR